MAGIKILEQLERMGRGVEVSLTKEIITSVLDKNNKKEMNEEERLKISFNYLEQARKLYVEDHEPHKKLLEKSRESYTRLRAKTIHSNRKEFLDHLEKLAKDLEDGLVMSEENERGLVKDMADATMRCQRDIKQIQDEVISDIDEQLLEMENIKSLWAKWATMQLLIILHFQNKS